MPVFLAALVALAFVPAQRPTDIVKWAAAPPTAHVAPGGVALITLTAKVQRGWKLYAIEQPEGGPVPVTFALEKGAPFQIAHQEIQAPKAKVQKQDENFAVDTHYYENEAAFTIPVKVNAKAGAHTIPLEVTFQACGAELCLRPFTEKLAVPITVRK
ncbi:MAG: protein-disulfide reductase DsbD domain-containing protein [Vicinamibacterales bacterium]